MTQVQTNVAISATTRDQRIRELTNEALSDYDRDLADARRCAMRGLTTGYADDLVWAVVLTDVANAEVVKRLHRMGVTE